MISSIIIKAAQVGGEAIQARHPDDMHAAMAEVGIGANALARFINTMNPDEGNEVLDAAILSSFLIGVFAERLLNSITDSDSAERVMLLAGAYPQTEDGAAQDAMADIADALYNIWGIEVEDGTTGEELLNQLEAKLAEDPDLDESATRTVQSALQGRKTNAAE